MEKDIALKEGKRRGWFSYTDLETLLDTVDLAALAQAVLTVSEHSLIVVLSVRMFDSAHIMNKLQVSPTLGRCLHKLTVSLMGLYLRLILLTFLLQ
jgi:hypothetical protein